MRYFGCALVLIVLAVSAGCASTSAEIPSAADACVENLGSPDCLVAIVRTKALQWEGEQTYIPLYADGTASGLVVVNFYGGLLYGTATPDSWTWLDKDTVEVCTKVNILRNEVGFPPMERDCAPHPITGKELDLDGNGDVDLVETFTIEHPLFHRERPDD